MLYFCSTPWVKALRLHFNLILIVLFLILFWWHTELKLWKLCWCPNIYRPDCILAYITILKGSYDAFLKIIILCIWCNRICWHALMFKKHIIFQILYIIVGPLCPPLSNASFSTKSLLPTSTVCSDWPTDPVHCDLPNTTSRVRNVTPLSIIASFSVQN